MNDAPTANAAPGFLAFIAFFILALALWFLMRNMNSRMRRMSYRQQQAHRGRNDPQAAPGEVPPGELRDERDAGGDERNGTQPPGDDGPHDGPHDGAGRS